MKRLKTKVEQSRIAHVKFLENENKKLRDRNALLDDLVMRDFAWLRKVSKEMGGCYYHLQERLELAEDLLISFEAIGSPIMDRRTWNIGRDKYLVKYRGKPKDM